MSKRLLSEIIKGAWMIEPQTALSHLPDVARFLQGNDLSTIEKRDVEGSHSFITPDGQETRKEQDLPQGSVMVVNITGTMIKYGTMCAWGADELVDKMKRAESDNRIMGSILKIDSGGGSVNAIGLYMDFLNNREKPVVALCDTAASAAYYTALGSDHIMAENNISSEFGSIGVMCQIPDFSEYFEKNGVKIHTIYSNLSQNKNEEFHKALNGEYDLIKTESLDPLAKKFQKDVKEYRPNLKLEEPGILNGKMFYAEKALEVGLIDSIGNMESAISKLKELAGSNNSIFNENNVSMTLEEFKASHPALYSQVFSEGEKTGKEAGKNEERVRVNAWLAHHDADTDKVLTGIKEGKELTADVREELMVASHMKQRTSTDDNADSTDTSVEAGKEMDQALEEDVKSIKNQW